MERSARSTSLRHVLKKDASHAKPPSLVKPLPVKKRAAFPVESYGLPKELGECINRDVELLKRVGRNLFSKCDATEAISSTYSM